ncbi:DUF3140 domain-containing protein [Amycolatopsis nigrescens]|uniref:DUF3140 domain-containing protein n=1 Tax=Amycolatopsis nigrescens TaxID=381445 RepID=UPI0003821190|nr:DUF3140 domain-containing protein [Amycolatopsis nigrescens]
MAAVPPEQEELWEEFHRVVNMTSRELAEWLLTSAATPETEPLPDKDAPLTGEQVLAILRKRKGDLDREDLQVMRKVVDRVHAERPDDLEPTAGQASWRHGLMSIGHDPLKPG